MWACVTRTSAWCLIQPADSTILSLWTSLFSQMACTVILKLGHRDKEGIKKMHLTNSALKELNVIHGNSRTEPHGDTRKHGLELMDLCLPLAPGAARCVNSHVLRLNKDRTGRDKGRFVAVFTANNAERTSCGRWRGRGLMTGTKEAWRQGQSRCVNLPWSQKKDIMHDDACVIPQLELKEKIPKSKNVFSTFTKRSACPS